MKLVVLGNDDSYNELINGLDHIEWIRVNDTSSFNTYEEIDAFFNLNEDAGQLNYSALLFPVFINSVIHPIGENKNIIRINGWKGFLEKTTWEIAGNINTKAIAVLSVMNKKFILTADEPGFISARIIAMIINEAYFAKGENVSSEEEIDIAMKLGTNYPYGPFEWGEKIGLKNIYNLLIQLSIHDKKYSPAPALLNLINL